MCSNAIFDHHTASCALEVPNLSVRDGETPLLYALFSAHRVLCCDVDSMLHVTITVHASTVEPLVNHIDMILALTLVERPLCVAIWILPANRGQLVVCRAFLVSRSDSGDMSLNIMIGIEEPRPTST